MKTIFKKYRKKLAFSNKETRVINVSIEMGVISTDDLIQDFWQFRDKNLKDFIDIDNEKVLDFNEYYDNGLTHTQNFVRLIEFINKVK